MSKLNLLVIEGDEKVEKNNTKIVPVHDQAYIAIQMFMYYLPKIELDGAGKLNICMESKPENEEKYMYDDYFKISVYYVEPELIEEAKSIEYKDKDEFYLRIIENVLLDIASKAGRYDELVGIIKETARKVREVNFQLLVKINKLSKMSSNKKLRARTYREITPQGEFSYVEIIDTNNVTRYNITNEYETWSLISSVSKCLWKENEFILMDCLEYTIATINVEDETVYSIRDRQAKKYASKIKKDKK